MAIGVKLDPVEAWGLVCTAYTRNALVANAWSQLPLAYRTAWVMFINQLLQEINGRLPPALEAAIREVQQARADALPLSTLREKLTEAIGKYQKVERKAFEDRRRFERKTAHLESRVQSLERQLAQARYQLEQYTGATELDLIGVRTKPRHSHVTEDDVYRRPGVAEDPFTLAFQTREQRERFEAFIAEKEDSHATGSLTFTGPNMHPGFRRNGR